MDNIIRNETTKETDEINLEIKKTSKKTTTKIKKKKKLQKKSPEKKCKNLKELFAQMEEENQKKILKSKKIMGQKSKEKTENKTVKENKSNINSSTSGTTIDTISLDNKNNTNNNILIEPEIILEQYDIRKKIFCPLFEYYKDTIKIMSKEKEGKIDLAKSSNFIEKKNFFNSFNRNKKLKKLNINPKEKDVKDKKRKNNNKFNTKNEIYYYNQIPSIFNFTQGNNDIQDMINNINNNINSYYYSISFNYRKQKNKNTKTKKTNTDNNIKVGDWTCSHCHNLNFSFRNSCNRCNAVKEIV